MVSLTLAQGEVSVPVSLRLFLPETWAADARHCASVGVPEELRRPEAKTDLALAEVDRVIAAGARFGRVLADAGYGISAAFRKGLSERGLYRGRVIDAAQPARDPKVTLAQGQQPQRALDLQVARRRRPL